MNVLAPNIATTVAPAQNSIYLDHASIGRTMEWLLTGEDAPPSWHLKEYFSFSYPSPEIKTARPLPHIAINRGVPTELDTLVRRGVSKPSETEGPAQFQPWQMGSTAISGLKQHKLELGGTDDRRVWQGRTRPGMGKAYYEYMEQTGLKEHRGTEGFRSVFVMRREIGDETECVLVSLWGETVRGAHPH